MNAIKLTQIMEQASLRVNTSDAHLERILSDKKLTNAPAEDVAKAALADNELSQAIKLSDNARKDLYNKITDPANSSIIEKLRSDTYVGENALSNLEDSLTNAVKTMEDNTKSKDLLGDLSEQMDEIAKSIQNFADNLLSSFSSKMTR
jgi:hypothetical protein